MTSLWSGDIAHIDISRGGTKMCVQLDAPGIADAAVRRALTHRLDNNGYNEDLRQGSCSNYYSNGVFHRRGVSVWVH